MIEKTVGAQIIENWGKHDAVECGDMSREVWWKTLQPKLKDTIEKHRNYSPQIYILLNMRNSGLMGHNAKQFTFLVAHEEFPPKASAMLIKYDYKTDRDELIWALPDENAIEDILSFPSGYDKKLVEDCHQYKNAKKIRIPISN